MNGLCFLFRRVCLLGSFLLALNLAVAAQDLAPRNSDQPATTSNSANASTAPSPAPAAAPASAPSVALGRKLAHELQVPGSRQWTDSAIDVVAGDRLVISAAGNLETLGISAGPQGLARTWRDLLRALPVNGAGGGALIGRIGDDPAVVPFLVGERKEITVISGGRLFLGINQLAGDQSVGSFKVKVQIVPQNQQASAAARSLALTSEFLAKVPRRVADVNGDPGDVVNFVIIGSKDKLQAAFRDAGWLLVDRTKTEALLHAILSSTAKQSYTEMPMSELYLFGRPQDFGYARAEPVQVVASRHHLRVWKAPFDFNAEEVWVGAATHDIGFEKDQRNGSVTHKIDPDIDVERDFLGACFKTAGAVAGTMYLSPADAVRKAHTATGGSFHSDGRVLVLALGH